MPGEEPNAHFGGHYTMIFPRPVYWTTVRGDGQPFVEEHPEYGRVYHTGSPKDELEMLEREGGLIWQSHPRTKGSTVISGCRSRAGALSQRPLHWRRVSIAAGRSVAGAHLRGALLRNTR